MKKIVFLMDPIAKINPKKDTSYILMQAGVNLGHEVYYLKKGGIRFVEGSWICECQRIDPFPNEQGFFKALELVSLCADQIDALFIRTDPPFDEDYLMHTWFLDQFPKSVKIINHPNGVRQVNEKIWVTQFRELTPKTVISRQISDFKAFLSQEGTIILKPCQLFGGAGVFKIHAGDSNATVIFELLSQNGTKDLIMQAYIPEAEIGDKRILLANGVAVGAVLRVHSNEDHRNNFFAGGSAQKTVITANDQAIIQRLAPELQKLGLNWVGIDIIGDYLIEVNVTSPTCLQEMNQLYGKPLENEVMASLLNG